VRRWLRVGAIGLAAGLGLVGAALIAARVALAAPLPEGAVPGPEAEALADRIGVAVDLEAWARTGAVRFTVFGHRYLWDRERNLVRYEDRRGVVLTEGWRPMGRAFRGGEQVGGSWKDQRVQKAYESFVNDAFWAFAPMKLRDDGTTRALVAPDQLLVSYGSGGVTPGDAYLWTVGPDGLPTEFRMWTSILPIPGLRATWSDWVTLRTGVKVATRHRIGPVSFSVTELDAAEHLSALEPGEDPFAPMYGP
jgi:hypothetical protein